MTSTYGVSPILKRNKQPLAVRTWGGNLTLSVPPHLLSKNKMFHLLCSQAPLILPKITSKSQWLCQCLMSWDCFWSLTMSSIPVPSLHLVFSVSGLMIFSKLAEKQVSISPSPWSEHCFHQEGKIYEGGERASITMWIIHLCHLFRNIVRFQPPVCPPVSQRAAAPGSLGRGSAHRRTSAAPIVKLPIGLRLLQRQESELLQANSLIHFNQVQYRCDLRISREVYNSSLHALMSVFVKEREDGLYCNKNG